MDASKFKKAQRAVKYVMKDRHFAKKAKEASSIDNRRIWLISERGTDAQDNGFHLYRYLREHPEEGIHPIYVIDPDSPDALKVSSLGGEMVARGSDYHYMLMHKAEALISTHTYGYTPEMNIFYKLAQKNLFNPKGVNVFLSHGVTDKDMSWLYRENYKPDIFLTSCYNEYDLVRNVYKQPESVVKKTGMPRYDALFEAPTPKKQVLIMPTWRVWLNNLSDEEFKKTNYFLFWNDLLTDKVLQKHFQEKEYKVIFYLHPEIKKRIHLFEHEGIEVRDSGIQDLMIESELLITDYSSVFSDMAYMGRKVIFYQFDKEDYATKHYKGLITDYSKFGTVINPSMNYIGGMIGKILDESNSVDQKWIKSEYFMNHDNQNTKRVIDEIKTAVALKKNIN